MARFVLVEASPWRVEDGVAQDVRLAGGGERAYDHRGFTDWRAGVARLPRYVAAFQYGEKGWSGAAVPQVAPVEFRPYSQAVIAELAAPLHWIGAPVTIRVGDDSLASPVYLLELTGTVRGLTVRNGTLTFTIADLAAKLDEPIVTKRFAGTGGLEGIAEAEGRLKRRSFGIVRNVEGLILNKAFNIYEFGDPAFGLAGIPVVRDKGAQGPVDVLPWQGSAQATFDALTAATPPSGGCTAAPSIACVKWWTVPAGPLTADIQADTLSTSNKPADVAKAILATAFVTPPGYDAATFAAINTARPESVGIHIDSESETTANVFDRLFIPLSVLWSVDNAGLIRLTEIKLTDPVETIAGQGFERLETFRPARLITVGYRKNHRRHNAGEISAAVSGLTIDDLGALATQDTVDFATQVVGMSKPEPNADVSAIVVPSEASVVIQADSAGTVKANELPRPTSFKLLVKGVPVTADAWEYRVLTGSLNNVTAATGAQPMGSNTLEITAIGPIGATLEISATYQGVKRPPLSPFEVTIKRDVAAVGGGGGSTGGGTGSGGGTSSQTSTFAATSEASNTYGTSVNQLPNVSTGAAGTLMFTAPLEYQVGSARNTAAAGNLYGKWLYRAVGSPTWIDVAAEIMASTPASRYNAGTAIEPDWITESGFISVAQQKTGLAADTEFEVALSLRDSRTDRAFYVVSGTATAQGS